MADLMGVMLKSMGVNPTEIRDAATSMQGMVTEIHGMLSTIIRQNELIIVHLGDSAAHDSALGLESEQLLTRMISDGRLSECAHRDATVRSGD